ncbi:hypothetical protein [Paenibacillus sp. 1P07SE]|uniref:glycosyl-4,4'-diaponeurosporenoate acyltransferase CrtO family protein n=1 Tax=Paenibacillus sp. 1P07SE TaxID=3132209 RepID=UPI0039A5372F
MFADLSIQTQWLLNSVALLIVHLLGAWIAVRLPAAWFRTDNWLTAPRHWEREGKVYERLFRIRRWKDRLPDGGSWFRDGFAKSVLASRTQVYLLRFAQETRRGEWTHWGMLLTLPLFLFWNTWSGMAALAGWMLVFNMPCIIVQRYNRARLLRVVGVQKRVWYTGVRTGDHP